MIPVKPGELVIAGNKNKIQIFELNSKKLKVIIDINRNIYWYPSTVLCMMNKKCLCVGGNDKITIIDVYNKNIFNDIEVKGDIRCLYKLNDNIFLARRDNDILQWKIDEYILINLNIKENTHDKNVQEIIGLNDSIICCADDFTIKIW